MSCHRRISPVHRTGDSFLMLPLPRRREPPRLCQTLVQYCPAVPANDVLQPVAQEPVPPEGHDGLILLPADPQVIRSSAVGTMGDGDLRLFFLSVFYQISSLTATDWPRFFKIGFNRQVEEGIMGNWSMRRRMMEPLWMTANQEPTVSPTNRRISAWCAAGRQEKPRRHSPALRRLGGCCKGGNLQAAGEINPPATSS